MANTTNLNLVKPAGTDYALVSVINGNMDIIDSKVGAIPANESAQSQIAALNNQIAIQTISSPTTIVSLVANGTKRYTATSSSVFTDFPGTNTRYYPIISICKTGNNAQIDISCVSGNNEPIFIRGYYENNTLYWYDVNNQIANIPVIKRKSITVNTTSNGNAAINSELGRTYSNTLVLSCRITSPTNDLMASPITYTSGGNMYLGIHVQTTSVPTSAYVGSVTVDVAYIEI